LADIKYKRVRFRIFKMAEDRGYLELSRREILTGLFGVSAGAFINDQINSANETLESHTIDLNYPDVGEIDGEEDFVENYSERVELGGSEYVFTPSKSQPDLILSAELGEDGFVDEDGIGSYDSGDAASFDVYYGEDIDEFLSGKEKNVEPMYESPLIGEGESSRFGGLFGNEIRVELLEADINGGTYHISREV
jgi:hypothetical protein